MKRLLYLITRAETGGAQIHVLELLKGLQKCFDLHLGVGGEGFLTSEARKLGVSVHLLPSLIQPLHPKKDLAAVHQVIALLKKVQPSLVHLHSSKAGLVGRLAARAACVPAVFTAHGFAFTDGVSWRRKLVALPSEWLAARLGGHIIAVSRYDYDLAQHYRVAAPSQMTLVYNGIPDVPYRGMPEQGEMVRVVMVARFAPPKDHALLLKALEELKNLDWELELIGDGPLQPLVQAEAVRLGLENRVRFAGACTDVAKRLAKAQVFVLISNYEGLPLSILEAMRAGLPVIASKVGGVAEAVVDGETGFLAPRGDAQALRIRLAQLIGDSQLRMQMGLAGRTRYETYFTLEQMLEKTLAVYEKMLKREVS